MRGDTGLVVRHHRPDRRSAVRPGLSGWTVVIHDVHLFRVKASAEPHGPWDLYEHVTTVSGDEAFRPLADSGCAMAGR